MEATLRARKAAYSLHARYEGKEITAGARAAFLRRFEREVDPDLLLTPVERQRRSLYARKAYMTGLALVSARVRGARRANRFGSVPSAIAKPNDSGKTTELANGTAEVSHLGRSSEGGAADGDGRPLRTD